MSKSRRSGTRPSPDGLLPRDSSKSLEVLVITNVEAVAAIFVA
jgi:hypothetical protein